MNKVSKKLRGEEKKLLKLQQQTKDLLQESEDAKAELGAVKVSFGKQAIAGDDVGKLSGDLSLKQNVVDILESSLQEYLLRSLSSKN